MHEPITSLIDLPAPHELPPEDATLRDYILFADRFNPMLQSRERLLADPALKEHYLQYVKQAWSRCVQQYKEGAPFDADGKDLLLCMGYDVALGPYLGVPERHKVQFYRQLVKAIQQLIA